MIYGRFNRLFYIMYHNHIGYDYVCNLAKCCGIWIINNGKKNRKKISTTEKKESVMTLFFLRKNSTFFYGEIRKGGCYYERTYTFTNTDSYV